MRRAPLRTVLGVALVFATLGVVGFVSQPSASAQSPPSRVIDQTYVCTTGVQAGVRKLELSAHSGTRDVEKPDKWKLPAYVEIGTPTKDHSLAFYWMLRMGAARGGTVDSPGSAEGSVEISPKLCRATRARVPLSTKGLSGGIAGQFTDDYECFPPRTLVARLRATFDTPARLKGNRFGFLEATGTPRLIEFAMRTMAGRPYVYGSVSASGKARLFFVGTCVRD